MDPFEAIKEIEADDSLSGFEKFMMITSIIGYEADKEYCYQQTGKRPRGILLTGLGEAV